MSDPTRRVSFGPKTKYGLFSQKNPNQPIQTGTITSGVDTPSPSASPLQQSPRAVVIPIQNQVQAQQAGLVQVHPAHAPAAQFAQYDPSCCRLS